MNHRARRPIRCHWPRPLAASHTEIVDEL